MILAQTGEISNLKKLGCDLTEIIDEYSAQGRVYQSGSDLHARRRLLWRFN
jgi:hypothetical protein